MVGDFEFGVARRQFDAQRSIESVSDVMSITSSAAIRYCVKIGLIVRLGARLHVGRVA
jgi:hypothetical protein